MAKIVIYGESVDFTANISDVDAEKIYLLVQHMLGKTEPVYNVAGNSEILGEV